MLTIRPDQMQVFREAAQLSFEESMVEHLAEFSPPLYAALGAAQMRKVVRFGVTRALRYELTLRGPVRQYLELMLMFGSHFDTDPQYAWAGNVLRDIKSGPQMARAERLFEKTMDYRRAVAGADDAHTLAALHRVAELARRQYQFAPQQTEAAILDEIARIYPQKHDWLGEAPLRALIAGAVKIARQNGLERARDSVLMSVLMLAFGHGCCDDMLYQWIGRTLNDPAINGAEARSRRLEKKALTWLRHVLGYFDAAVAS